MTRCVEFLNFSGVGMDRKQMMHFQRENAVFTRSVNDGWHYSR